MKVEGICTLSKVRNWLLANEAIITCESEHSIHAKLRDVSIHVHGYTSTRGNSTAVIGHIARVGLERNSDCRSQQDVVNFINRSMSCHK
jgi:hypothetical protein